MHKVGTGLNGVMLHMTDVKREKYRTELDMKYTVKTLLNNIRKDDDGQYTYDQKLVSMKWTEETES